MGSLPGSTAASHRAGSGSPVWNDVAMSLPENLLGKDESVVVHLRTHPKVIIVPVLLGGVVLFGAIMAWMFMPLSWHPWSTMFVGILALVLLGWWTVAPVLRWLTTT